MVKSWQTKVAATLVAAGMIVDSAAASPAGMTASRPVQTPNSYVATPTSPPATAGSVWQSTKGTVSSPPIFTAFKSDKHPSTAVSKKPQTDSISLSTPSGPPTPQLMIAMAQLQEQRGDSNQARQLYQQRYASGPATRSAPRGARMEDRIGNLPVAENLYQQVATACPQNAGALNDLGLCMARQGKLEASLATLEQAIRLEPDKPLFRNNAATVCVEMRQDQRAMAHLSAVHTPAEVQFNMGQFLVVRNRPQRGRAILQGRARS